MSAPLLRCLFLEDSATDALLVARELRKVATVDVALNEDMFRTMLTAEKFDVVLLDFALPRFSGEEAIAVVKQLCPETPIILCTGSINDHSASAYLRSGASDYVLKDRLGRLPEAVRRAHETTMLRKQAMRENRLELLGSLSAGLSHDFNQLLQTFYAGTELLRRKTTDQADQRVLDAMLSAAQRGAEMTKQITSFARGSNGGTLKPVSAEFLMTEIGTTLRLTFPKEIRIQIATAPGTWKVLCDSAQVHQVLLNLAANSKDALAGASGEIHITAQNATMNTETLNGDFVMIVVRDTAGGIPAKVLDNLFTPFTTTKAKDKGTGLGLAMSKGIVNGHGGEITVETSPSGTAFSIYLPVGRDETHAEKVTRLEEFDGTGKTIVLVDDESFMRTLLSMHLSDAGYKTLVAQSGAEALSLFRSNERVDLLLTDYSMAHMNGVELIAALRGQGIPVPAVLITGHADLPSAVFDPEPDAIIRKPFTRAQLLSAIERVLDTARSSATLAP